MFGGFPGYASAVHLIPLTDDCLLDMCNSSVRHDHVINRIVTSKRPRPKYYQVFSFEFENSASQPQTACENTISCMDAVFRRI